MELLQIKCPTCKSSVLQSHTTYATQHHGSRIIYKCASCLDEIPPLAPLKKPRIRSLRGKESFSISSKCSSSMRWFMHASRELSKEMKHRQRYRRMSLQISHAGGPYCSWTEPVDSFGSEIVARRIEDSLKRRSRHWTRLRDRLMI